MLALILAVHSPVGAKQFSNATGKMEKALDWWEQNPDKLPDRIGFYRVLLFAILTGVSQPHLPGSKNRGLVEKFDGCA